MKILYLTIKKEWYDMIASGEKPEEYREIKEYWIRRLVSINYPEEYPGENRIIPENIIYDIKVNGHPPVDIIRAYYSELRNFDLIHFARGGHFHPLIPQMTLECKGIEIGKGNHDWGAPSDKDVFIIKLGDIIS